jgi:alcohol dehydrogenase
VAVIGDGKLGMLVAMVLRLTGCDLTLIGHHPERWQMLTSDGIVCVASNEIADDTTSQHTYDIVVDCTGHASGLATARQLVRPRGTLIIKSTYHGTSTIDLSAIVVDEVNIVGSRCGPFAPALRLLERHLVEPIALISERFALSDALDAFAAAQHNLKVLLMVQNN